MEEALRLNLSDQGEDAPPDTAEYVGFWPRVAARAIDTGFHLVITLVTGFATAIYFVVVENLTGRSAATSLELMERTTFTSASLGFLGFVLYGAISEGLHGSTLGKRWLGMVVLRETKTRCGLLAAGGRWIAVIFDSLVFGVVGYYAMGTNRRQQRYGDRWFRTVVVRRRSIPREVLHSNLRFVFVLALAVAVDGLVSLLRFQLLAAG